MHIFLFVVIAGLFSLQALAVSSSVDVDSMVLQHGRREMPLAPVPVPAHSPSTIVGESPSADVPSQMVREQRARFNAEQYAHAVADSKHLTQLAAELEADLERAGGNTLPSAAFRKADEIARLAKSVKQELKPR